MKKVTRIIPGDRHTLAQLDVKPGDWVGFNQIPISNLADRFILAYVGKQGLRNYEGLEGFPNLYLTHDPTNSWGDDKSWQLYILDAPYGSLWLKHLPEHLDMWRNLISTHAATRELKLPGIEVARKAPSTEVYPINRAYAGKEEIVNALTKLKGYKDYASWFEHESEKLPEH